MSAPLFDADLYRLLHRGYPGDVAFYCRVCGNQERVLELGCGDGRVSLSLAETGAKVTGIDHHPGMVAAACNARADAPPEVRARLRYLEGDIRHFRLPDKFDRIIAPYTTLYALNPEDRLQCLRSVVRHLAPEGQLVFDGYPALWIQEQGSYADPTPILISRVVHLGQTIDVFEQDRHDADAKRVSVTYIHEFEEARPPVEYTIQHYYLLRDDLPDLLGAAGLELVAVHGDFVGTPFEETAERMVVFAQEAT